MQQNEVKNEKRTPNAADYLRGQSPHSRGKEKLKNVLEWVFKWGYSSAEIIREVARQKGKGYAIGLVKKGLLVRTKTESGVPRYFYTLSEMGLYEAERLADGLHRYPEENPYKVNQQQIRHNLLAQEATNNALKKGSIANYKTERMFDQLGDKAGEKRPDVVWIMASGKHVGVEIELTGKWDRRIDEFILGVFLALRGNPAKYARFVIVSDSPAIIRRYEEAMQPNAELKIWKKNNRQHFEVDKVLKVPDWLIEQVDFCLL